jgi:hypothetical protein
MSSVPKYQFSTLATVNNPTQEPAPSTVEIGVIQSVDDAGRPAVRWHGSARQHVEARTQVRLTERDIGRECTLAFAGGDPSRPIVMGLLYTPDTQNDPPEIIQTDDAIILQSGESRIELHADGRINIQGMYINSQAYGPHHLKGASVKIN